MLWFSIATPAGELLRAHKTSYFLESRYIRDMLGIHIILYTPCNKRTFKVLFE